MLAPAQFSGMARVTRGEPHAWALGLGRRPLHLRAAVRVGGVSALPRARAHAQHLVPVPRGLIRGGPQASGRWPECSAGLRRSLCSPTGFAGGLRCRCEESLGVVSAAQDWCPSSGEHPECRFAWERGACCLAGSGTELLPGLP